MFLSIKGKVYEGGYYDVVVHEDNTDYGMCASYSTGILTGKYTGGDEALALECHAWGYDGLGPQLLACNILNHYANGGNEDIARKYYKEFTTEVIARLPDDKPWTLTRLQINRWLRNKQNQRETK